MQNNTIDNKLNINKNSNFKLPKINVLNFVKFINMTKLSKASKISNIPKVLNGLKSPKDIKYNKLSSDIFNERSSVFIKDIKKNSILNNITKYLKNKKKKVKKDIH